VGANAVDWMGSLSFVVLVVLVFLVIVVVGCIVGCSISISIVVGIIIWEVVVSHIKPAWMLAFSASKSMHCGGGVMGR